MLLRSSDGGRRREDIQASSIAGGGGAYSLPSAGENCTTRTARIVFMPRGTRVSYNNGYVSPALRFYLGSLGHGALAPMLHSGIYLNRGHSSFVTEMRAPLFQNVVDHCSSSHPLPPPPFPRVTLEANVAFCEYWRYAYRAEA